MRGRRVLLNMRRRSLMVNRCRRIEVLLRRMHRGLRRVRLRHLLGMMRRGDLRSVRCRLLARHMRLRMIDRRSRSVMRHRFSAGETGFARMGLSGPARLGVSARERGIMPVPRVRRVRGISGSSHGVVHLDRMAARLGRRLEMGLLLCRRRDMATLCNRPFMRRGLGRQATPATIVTDAIARITDHRPVHISVVHMDTGDVIGRGIVGEVIPFPTTAAVAMSPVTVTVIDAAVESHGRTPITLVKAIASVGPSPVARRPKEADLRWLAPSARYPVVFAGIRVIGPVSGSPQVTVTGTNGLRVHQQCRWGDAHGD